MKKLLMLLLVLLVACAPVKEKVFVANEESGSISVIDAVSLKEIGRISLTTEHEGARVDFAPHNVQVVGDKVLVTANVGAHEDEHEEDAAHVMPNGSVMDHDMAPVIPKVYFGVVAVEAHGEEESEDNDHPDQLIVIDAKSNKIVGRIDLDIGAHLAHVVSDGKYAYVTATNSELLYKVDLATGKYFPIVLPKGSMPHGARLTPDGKTAIIAAMGNALLLVNLETKNITTLVLPGKGVQAGIAGNIAMASVYDTKQLALFDIGSNEVSYVDLPVGARGPVQMYQTPDNKFVYVADQGVYFDQPPGRNTYKIDLSEKKVVATIETGDAPHGVVVSPDGRVWVTNLNGNSVSVINKDVKVAEIPVGVAPNGISYWKSA